MVGLFYTFLTLNLMEGGIIIRSVFIKGVFLYIIKSYIFS